MTRTDYRAIDKAKLREAPCPTLQQELRVVLSEAAFDRAVARGSADTTREIGGVLVGEAARDAGGPYVRIDDTIDALHAEEGGAELTFTHATWDHIHKEMDGAHKGKSVVGWYHTHPGFGIFLSDRDQFIHQSFFDLPFQLAFVYDPKSREHGFFGWRDGQPTRLRRYWIGDREQSWEGPRHTGKVEPEQPSRANGAAAPPRHEHGQGAAPVASAETSSRSESEKEGTADWSTMALSAIAMLLVGGMIGFWVGGRGAAEAVERGQLEVLEAKQAGAASERALLHGDLLGILRGALNDDQLKGPVTATLADLEAVRASLKDPALATVALDKAKGRLRQMREARLAAGAIVSELEKAGKGRGPSASDVAKEVASQRAYIGGLYKELADAAGKAGDTERAGRLLATAAMVDPGNAARYVGAPK